jgi:hypothetical protein
MVIILILCFLILAVVIWSLVAVVGDMPPSDKKVYCLLKDDPSWCKDTSIKCKDCDIYKKRKSNGQI